MGEEIHICKQEAKLGAIEANLKAKDDTDARIESNLKDLVQAVNDNHRDALEEFRAFSTNFANIESVLKEQKAKADESCTIQKEIKGSLSNLTTRVGNIETEVINHKKEIADLSDKARHTEARLTKIEGWALRIIAIITALGLVVEFFSNLDSIKKFMFPELNGTVKVEQTSHK